MRNFSNIYIFIKYKLIGYFYCVNDILMIHYNEMSTNMKEIFLEFTMVCSDLKFTIEKVNQKIDFLDITIHKRMKARLEFSHLLKTPTIDCIILHSS